MRVIIFITQSNWNEWQEIWNFPEDKVIVIYNGRGVKYNIEELKNLEPTDRIIIWIKRDNNIKDEDVVSRLNKILNILNGWEILILFHGSKIKGLGDNILTSFYSTSNREEFREFVSVFRRINTENFDKQFDSTWDYFSKKKKNN